jgi:hypothetical protein
VQDVGQAALQIIPSFKGLQGDLERGSSKALTAAGVSGGTKFGNSAGKSAGQRFGSVFKSAAKAGIVGALALTAGAIKLGVDALGEARDSQKVARQTHAVLKSTGGAAKVSAGDVGKLANKLSYMAGVDDELVQSAENVLLTFKGVRNEQGKHNKIFDRGTKVALNMSAALGTDLKGSAIQVGKALGDPVKGVTALSRVGVVFTKQQKAQIKALVEGGDANAAMALGLIDSTTTYNNLLKANGDDSKKVADILEKDLTPAQKKAFDHYAEGNHTLEAQKTIVKELGSEFGGSARAQASAGDRLKVAFGNVEEKLGKGLLPVVQEFQRFLLRKGIPILDDFAGWFKKDGRKAIDDFIAKAKPVVQKWLPKIGDGFKTAGNFAKNAAGFAGDVVDAFDKMPGWVKKILIGGVLGGVAAKKLNLFSLLGSTKGGAGGISGSGLLGLVTKAKPLPVFVVNNIGGAGGGLPGVLGGGGAGGAGSTIGKLPKFLPLVPVGLDSAPGQESLLHKLTGFGPGGGQPKVGDKAAFDKMQASIRATGTEWDKVRNKADDYFADLERHSALKFTVLGWDVANRDARKYLATLLQIRDAHVTAGFDTPTPGQVPNHTPSRNGDTGTKPSGRGVFDGAQINIQAHDYKDFVTQVQRRAIRANTDNLRGPG